MFTFETSTNMNCCESDSVQGKRLWVDVCVNVQGYQSMRSSGKTSMGGKGRVRDTDGLRLQNVGKSYKKKWINTSSVPQLHTHAVEMYGD